MYFTNSIIKQQTGVNLCLTLNLPAVVESVPTMDGSNISRVIKEVRADGAVGSNRHFFNGQPIKIKHNRFIKRSTHALVGIAILSYMF